MLNPFSDPVLDWALFRTRKAQLSFSQSGEDRILQFLFQDRNVISYLDIGTNHPQMSNNTYLFYRHHSKGVCVEPNPILCKQIERRRVFDKLLNIGIGPTEGEADFYVMKPHSLSTFVKEDAEALDAQKGYSIEKVINIPIRTFNSVIREDCWGVPDLVSIDVEGWNEAIVQSIDFSIRPEVFCVETVEFSEDNSGRKLTSIIDIFERNGYKVYADTHINTIFVRQ